jgi:ribosome-associated toxin RatA of RatAB toxin-antitoxin module
MLKKTSFLFFTFTLLLSFKSDQTASDTWQLKKFESGIAIYTRNAENSKFKELKSVATYKCSLSSIIALIDDFESYPQWVYKCGISKTVKRNSDNDLIHYQTVTAPWPVANRDFVVHAEMHQDPITKIVTQTATCIPDYLPRVEGHVRITEFRAQWTLIPLKNGYVEADYQLLVNPGGNIPAWLVNLAVVDGPFETALNMKKWLMKEKYQKTILPFIKEL